MDKEFAEWLHSKSCSQSLEAHMETNDEWCSSGVNIGTVTV